MGRIQKKKCRHRIGVISPRSQEAGIGVFGETKGCVKVAMLLHRIWWFKYTNYNKFWFLLQHIIVQTIYSGIPFFLLWLSDMVVKIVPPFYWSSILNVNPSLSIRNATFLPHFSVESSSFLCIKVFTNSSLGIPGTMSSLECPVFKFWNGLELLWCHSLRHHHFCITKIVLVQFLIPLKKFILFIIENFLSNGFWKYSKSRKLLNSSRHRIGQ